MAKEYSKREFLTLGSLGIIGTAFLSCYKKEQKPLAPIPKVTPQIPEKKIPQTVSEQKEQLGTIQYSEKNVIFYSREDDAYANLSQSYNQRIKKQPKLIAVCKSEKGVQQAVKRAKKEQLQIAIRSGGHSFEGFSNIDDGLLLDVSQLKSMHLKGDTLHAQTGVLLQELYAYLLPKNRILPAGSCGTVGLGGLALGGGYGFFARKYGLTCDHITGLTMVDANGDLIQSQDDKELEWALKGGGNGNFGVVTSFTFRTQKAPSGFSSYRFKFRKLNKERFLKIKDAWFAITQDNLPSDAFSAFVLNGNTLTILFTSFESSLVEMEQLFAPLQNLSDEYKKWPQQALARALKRYYGIQHAIPFKNASAGYISSPTELGDAWSTIYDKVQAYKGVIFQWNTLGGEISQYTQNNAYPHRDAKYLGELQAYWDNDTQSAKRIKGFKEIQLLLRQAGITKHYRNYPDIDFTNANQSYFGEQLTRLQEIKAEYDPDNLFWYPQVINLN